VDGAEIKQIVINEMLINRVTLRQPCDSPQICNRITVIKGVISVNIDEFLRRILQTFNLSICIQLLIMQMKLMQCTR